MSTDQDKLQATFTYDDAKVKIDQICDTLDKKSNGRYRASVAEAPKNK